MRLTRSAIVLALLAGLVACTDDAVRPPDRSVTTAGSTSPKASLSSRPSASAVVKPLAAPEVDICVDVDGYPIVAWSAVPGAVTYEVGLRSRIAAYSEKVLARGLKVTTYRPSSVQLEQFYVINRHLRGAVQDQAGSAWEQQRSPWWNPHDITVVAVGAGEQRSEAAVVDGVTLAGQLPIDLAPAAISMFEGVTTAAVDTDGDRLFTAVADLPGSIALTMGDGSTRLRGRVVEMAAASAITVTVAGPEGDQSVDCVLLPVNPVKTKLAHQFRLCGDPVRNGKLTKAARKALRKQNRQVTEAAVVGDLAEAAVEYAKGAPSLGGDEPVVTTKAEVAFPVMASNDLTDFIVHNVMAGQACMRAPNWPDGVTLEAAVSEAQYQNPYLLGVPLWVADSDGQEFCLGGVPDAAEAAAERDNLAGLVAEIVATRIGAEMNDYDRLVALNDYLTEQVSYDFQTYDPNRDVLANVAASADRPRAYTALGALEDGNAVCLGYAEAFEALAQAAGLTAVVVTGTAGGQAHAWNKVRLDGTWFNVDVTWNDAETGGQPNQYLALTDRALAAARSGQADTDTWVPAPYISSYTAD